MNFNPQNENGLMSLLAGLEHGLDPTTAYGVLQDIQSQQEQDTARRQERLGGLSQLLMEAATSGMPQAGAAALAEAAPGPMGPAVQNMLGALYPEQGMPDQSFLQASQDQFGNMQAERVQPEQVYAQSQSPTFVPPQPSPTEAMAMQEAQAQAQSQADWAKVQQQLGAAKAQNKPLDAVLAAMTGNPAYAAVIGQDPGQFQKMVEITYGPQALAMLGMNL